MPEKKVFHRGNGGDGPIDWKTKKYNDRRKMRPYEGEYKQPIVIET